MNTVFLVYVQFNSSYEGKAGFVGEWKPGYYPAIYSMSEMKCAQRFPSEAAAKAFLNRMKSHFGDRIKYGEVIEKYEADLR